ncbi:MAG: hypothetical protein Q8P21_01980 [bacterium]|nr:hypothetical protein [bacterium]
MKELQRKQRIRRTLYSVPSLVLMSVIALGLVKGVIRVAETRNESWEQTRALEERAAALALREQEIKEGIARLGTEEGVKDEIRDKFSVTQEGEYVAVVSDERNAAVSSSVETLPWYKKFWNVIMSRINTNEVE